MENIYINNYISYNPDNGWFELSNKAEELLYRKKQVICSYSGCTEWGHKFFCELLDLYSGNSQYNYSLGTVIHENEIARGYQMGHGAEVTEWITKHKNDDWFSKAAAMLGRIIEDVPEY